MQKLSNAVRGNLPILNKQGFIRFEPHESVRLLDGLLVENIKIAKDNNSSDDSRAHVQNP